MRTLSIVLSLLSIVPLVCGGCATHAESGAAAGGLLGAATGAIIGSQTGNAGSGAAIGGALGAIGGSLIGAGQDDIDRRNRRRIAVATAKPTARPISVAEVVHMTQSGVGDDVIVSSIHSSRSVFHLNSTDVITLHNQNVSDRVIQVMLDSARRPVVVENRPVIYHRRPVYVEPSVHFGYGYGRHHGPYRGHLHIW